MCKRAREIIASLEWCRTREDLIDALSVLLLIRDLGPIGRPSISRILGLGDKRTRNILLKLREASLLGTSRAGAFLSNSANRLLNGVYCSRKGDYTIAGVACNIEDPELVSRNIITLRDSIVIALSDPGSLEVIGWFNGDKLALPRVSEELAKGYQELVKDSVACSNGCLVTLFRTEGICYRCCASLVHAASIL